MTDLNRILKADRPMTLARVPGGFLPPLLADLARAAAARGKGGWSGSGCSTTSPFSVRPTILVAPAQAGAYPRLPRAETGAVRDMGPRLRGGDDSRRPVSGDDSN